MLTDMICQIFMDVINDVHSRLYVKIRRGKEPKLEKSEDQKSVIITVPLKQEQKWPALTATLRGGITVILQRLEQQYKISVQYMSSRKPEFTVFVAPLAYEGDLRTLINCVQATRLHNVGISGPNMEISGNLKVPRLTLESSVGTLEVNGRIAATALTLQAQHVHVATEALVGCEKLKITARRVQIDGQIFPHRPMENNGGVIKSDSLMVKVDAALLHIGIDGVVGAMRSAKHVDKTGKSESDLLADCTALVTSGSLANYGRILARLQLQIHVAGSVLSLQDGRIDSASRGYNALKQIHGLETNNYNCHAACNEPTSSRLSAAVVEQDAGVVARLLESGVDPNDCNKDEESHLTPRRLASMRYRKLRGRAGGEQQRAKVLERIALINALFVAHDWRRGAIMARLVKVEIGKNCEDCAQFNGSECLIMAVQGSAICEANSIWSSGAVELTINDQMHFHGQTKFKQLVLSAQGDLLTSEEAIVNVEGEAEVSTRSFRCAGIWSICEEFRLATNGLLDCLRGSYVEAERLIATVEAECLLAGTWQVNWLEGNVKRELVTTASGRCLMDESADVTCDTFNCSGTWIVNDAIRLVQTASCNFFHGSKLECRTLKLSTDKHCILGGQWSISTLYALVRHDFITTSTGRCNIDINGQLAAGSFRNGNHWQSEQNLQLFIASMSQSEDALIFVKNTLQLHFFAQTTRNEENWLGRVVASKLQIQTLKAVVCNAFIRVNEIEFDLPYINESQFVVGGQMEVLIGPIIAKGTGDFSNIFPTRPHQHPALVVDGVLKVQAIVAPFLPIAFGEKSYVQMSGMQSIVENSPFKTLISCGALHTKKSSMIEVLLEKDAHTVDDNILPEAIICAVNWIHEGFIRFCSQKVFIFADSLVHCGRLTASTKYENHLHEAIIQIANMFVNRGVLSADIVMIYGDGILENRNRIFAADKMNIRLRNFTNDNGKMESDNQIRLLCDTSELTRVGGKLRARQQLDVIANRLALSTKNQTGFVLPKRMSLTANTELRVTTRIHANNDENLNLVFKANETVGFDSCLVLERLEIEVGNVKEEGLPLENGTVHISKSGAIRAREVQIRANCKRLCIIVDGELSAQRIVVDGQHAETVFLEGQGKLCCSQKISLGNIHLAIGSFADVILVTQIECRQLSFEKQVRIASVKQWQSISTNSLQCDGVLQINGKLLICPFDQQQTGGAVNVSGKIAGSTKEDKCELSFECEKLNFSHVEFENMSFLEIFCNEELVIDAMSRFNAMKSVAIDARKIRSEGAIVKVVTAVINGTEVELSGSMQGDGQMSQLSICGKGVVCEGEFSRFKKVELSARNELIIRESSMVEIDEIELDAKWLHCDANVKNCSNFTESAWAILNQGNIEAKNSSICSLSICVNKARICSEVSSTIAAPFLLMLNPNSNSISQQIWRNFDLKSIVLISEHLELSENNCASLFHINLTEKGENSSLNLPTSEETLRRWKSLQDQFRTSSIQLHEILLALKRLNGLSKTQVTMVKNETFDADLQDLCGSFCKARENASVLQDFQKFIDNFQLFSVANSGNQDGNNVAETLDSFSQSNDLCFLLEKNFGPRTSRQPSKSPSPTSPDMSDIGYASHSSSEEADDRPSPRRNRRSDLENEGENENGEMQSQKNNESKSADKDDEEERFDDVQVECESTRESEERQRDFEYEDRTCECQTSCSNSIEESIDADSETDNISEEDSNYVVFNVQKVAINRIEFVHLKKVINSRDEWQTRRPHLHIPSSTDLIMKKIQLKRTLSNVSTMAASLSDSQSSLTSLTMEIGGVLGTPMTFQRVPLRRSLIPRASFRRAAATPSPVKNEAMQSPLRH